MINDKIFSHRPISELMAIVRNDLRKFDDEGLIDEGNLVKTVMYCNDKLGIPIREVRQVVIPVDEFRADLPLDFEKLYYVCALSASNSSATRLRNPFDNNFDQDILYDAQITRDSLGGVENYKVEIHRETEIIVHHQQNWIELGVSPSSPNCHIDCPNKRGKHRYEIQIKDDHIDTPFRCGSLYMMYVGMMKDVDGNITFPFHPMITPYYEWMLKEKIISNAIFNSDGTGLGDLFKLAQNERAKAWLDAFNFTTDKGFGEMVSLQRKRELGWYNQYFKHFQDIPGRRDSMTPGYYNI